MGWFEEMTPGTTLTAAVREIIETAMRAFSDHQRQVMIRAGVRFWPDQALPPEFDALVQRGQLQYHTGGAARYFPSIRILHLFGTVSIENVRHELAHCWDHVRRGNVHSLRGLSGHALAAAIARPSPFTLSSTDRVERYLGLYRRRLAELSQSHRLRPGCRPQTQFNSLSDRYKLAGWDYPARDAAEFYAECYRLFHAPAGEPNAPLNYARMWLYAREMYDLLEHESGREHSPVPDPAALRQAIQDECLPEPVPIH